jgi:hypothetical protein
MKRIIKGKNRHAIGKIASREGGPNLAIYRGVNDVPDSTGSSIEYRIGNVVLRVVIRNE